MDVKNCEVVGNVQAMHYDGNTVGNCVGMVDRT